MVVVKVALFTAGAGARQILLVDLSQRLLAQVFVASELGTDAVEHACGGHRDCSRFRS